MKHLSVLLVALAMLAGMAFAAEEPQSKVDVFGGYQYVRASGVNANGWNAELTANANKHLGLVADFGGAYCRGEHAHSFMFGPQVSASLKEAKQVKPFVHALFGAERSTYADQSDTGFAMAIGGGVDVNVHKHLSLRLAQFDWQRAYHGEGHNRFAYTTGVVFHFGGN